MTARTVLEDQKSSWPPVRAAVGVAAALVAVSESGWLAECWQRWRAAAPNEPHKRENATVDDASDGQPMLWPLLRAALTHLQRCARGAVTVALLRALEVKLNAWTQPYPGALVGLFLLLAVLRLADLIREGQARRFLEWFCAPGVQFLSTWMPLFFAPPLVSMPLTLQKARVRPRMLGELVAVVAAGFVTTLLSTAAITRTLLRYRLRRSPPTAAHPDGRSANASRPSSPVAPPTPASEPVQWVLGVAVALLCASPPQPRRDAALLAALTALSYRLGACSVPAAWRRFLHPVVTCAVITASATAWGEWAHTVHPSAGTVTPAARLAAYADTAGAWLMKPLGPSLIALAFRLDRARQLMTRQALPLAGGSAAATAISLAFSAAAARLLARRTSSTAWPRALRDALLLRSITTPLAVAAARRLGADVGVTVAAVVLSGILGANFGRLLLSKTAFTEQVPRGVALGAASHGLGTAVLAAEGESEAASAATVSMSLVGALTTVVIGRLGRST